MLEEILQHLRCIKPGKWDELPGVGFQPPTVFGQVGKVMSPLTPIVDCLLWGLTA